MTRNRRTSPQTATVLRALAVDPTVWRHGYELCVEVGLSATTMYPILIRLADRGLLEAAWETPPPGEARPPRHLYRLTAAGASVAATVPAPAGATRPGHTNLAAAFHVLRPRTEGGAPCC